MGVIILFLAVLGAIAAWWLSHQRLMAKPWLEAGPVGDVSGAGSPPISSAKVGLGFLHRCCRRFVYAFPERLFHAHANGGLAAAAGAGAVVVQHICADPEQSSHCNGRGAAAKRDEMDGVTFWLAGAGA